MLNRLASEFTIVNKFTIWFPNPLNRSSRMPSRWKTRLLPCVKTTDIKDKSYSKTYSYLCAYILNILQLSWILILEVSRRKRRRLLVIFRDSRSLLRLKSHFPLNTKWKDGPLDDTKNNENNDRQLGQAKHDEKNN